MCLAPKVKRGELNVTPAENLWTLGDRQYDLNEFAAVHPGGAHAIHLAEGLDCTALFLSYHPAEFVRRLQQYAVDSASPNTVHGDTAKPLKADPLLVDLRQRVTRAMGPIRDLKTPAWGWAVNALTVAVYALTIYAWAVAPCVTYAMACGFMGFICAGFLQHEGSHNALSHRQWINTLGRYMIMPWADPAEWFRAHVATHHPYTNTALDPDFQHADPLVRHHPESTWQWTHRTMLAVLVAYGPLLPFFYSIDGRAAGSSLRRAIKPTLTDPSAWESRLYLVLTPSIVYAHYAVHHHAALTHIGPSRAPQLHLCALLTVGAVVLPVCVWCRCTARCCWRCCPSPPSALSSYGSRSCRTFRRSRRRRWSTPTRSTSSTSSSAPPSTTRTAPSPSPSSRFGSTTRPRTICCRASRTTTLSTSASSPPSTSGARRTACHSTMSRASQRSSAPT